MKRILLGLLLIFSSLTTYSQVYNKYIVQEIDSNILVPRYLIGVTDTKIDTLGIVITIKQAQKIDNDLELLNMYRIMHIDCDSSISFLVQVVDDYKKSNILAQEKFKAYDIEVADGKKQITNLKSQISIVNDDLIDLNKQIVDKNSLIDIDKLQIKHLRRQRNCFIIGGSAITGGLLYLLILKK